MKDAAEHSKPSFNLELTLPLLAENIQNVMAALYKIETAAINARPAAPRDKFEEDRGNLRDLWENIKRFLQDCDAYADDFVSLGGFLENKGIEECSEFLKSLSSGASRLSREAKGILKDHDVKQKKIQKHGREVARWIGPGKYRRKSTGTWPDRSTEPSRKQSTGTSRRSTAPPATTSVAVAANAALNPDGPQSIAAFASASNNIRTHLSGLVGFWEDQCGIFSTKRNIPIAKLADLKGNSDKWKTYQPVLMSAIISIAASSDAVTVHAIGAPRSISPHSVTRPSWSLSGWLRSLRREGY